VYWIGLTQDRYSWRALVNAIMNLPVRQNAGKLSSSYITSGISNSAQLHRVSSLENWTHVCTEEKGLHTNVRHTRMSVSNDNATF
jgi:hypothetical protein